MTIPSPTTSACDSRRPAASVEARSASGEFALGSIPLIVESPIATSGSQPVTVGVPLPQGLLAPTSRLALVDPAGASAPLQSRPLAHWPDGSVKWALLDFMIGPAVVGEDRWRLTIRNEAGPEIDLEKVTIRIEETAGAIVVDTGKARFHLDRRRFVPITQVEVQGERLLDETRGATVLTDDEGRRRSPRIDRAWVAERGAVRATIQFAGVFEGGRRPCRFEARVSFFAMSSLVRVELALHNPRRARHRDGLWDLGDPNSFTFRDLTVAVGLRGDGLADVHWKETLDQPVHQTCSSPFEIYQESSGGENWKSRNHVNRYGEIPLHFRGYRVTVGEQERYGERASPTVELRSSIGRFGAAFPEFWQQFPKALAGGDQTLQLHLFPRQFADGFELQGGERKAHTFWLDFAAGDSSGIDAMAWAHRPALARCLPQWYADAGVVPFLTTASSATETPLDDYLAPFIDGPNDLDARREVVDEYGWRHYGDLHADHEAAEYSGPSPIISHYNNQYDVLHGMLVQYLRTGDPRWFQNAAPLARHVMDIDVYHTTEDKSAYNGGLFWHTDHWRDAATASHRSYSRSNKTSENHDYGGGPCNEHNYTSGLLLFHYLTGDPQARETVVGLADWVVAMDDGSVTLFSLIDDGPTGLASCTTMLDYQGPGRGGGNSINALLDAWLLTDDRRYLEHVDRLIRRAVHPAMNINDLDLMNVEPRWSYTVFLVALVRYLMLKQQCGELDFMYSYSRASLLAFAAWMAENEQPYFDTPEKLEHPTETWAAQELRKGNVLRLAAAYAEEPLRTRLVDRGAALVDRAWNDLLNFDSRYTIRALAITMTEGERDLYCRSAEAMPAPPTGDDLDFGSPELFVPQKRRVLRRLKSPMGFARSVLKLARVSRWRRYLTHRRLVSN